MQGAQQKANKRRKVIISCQLLLKPPPSPTQCLNSRNKRKEKNKNSKHPSPGLIVERKKSKPPLGQEPRLAARALLPHEEHLVLVAVVDAELGRGAGGLREHFALADPPGVREELVLEVLVDPFLDDDVVLVALLNRSANKPEIRCEGTLPHPIPRGARRLSRSRASDVCDGPGSVVSLCN